jgi:hypothetical protein
VIAQAVIVHVSNPVVFVLKILIAQAMFAFWNQEKFMDTVRVRQKMIVHALLAANAVVIIVI